MIINSVIIINYNTCELTLQAIDSVWKFSNKATTEIIVVDNASGKEDFNQLELGLKEKPDTHLVRSRINLGFGGGNMFGIQHAKGKYYAFLNSDAFLLEDTLGMMASYLDLHNHIAIVGANSVDENGHRYKGFDHPLSLRRELFGDNFLQMMNPKKYPSRKSNFTIPTKVGAVPGSLLFCRAEDFDNVGGFDNNLFLYYEEKDLSHRIKKKLGKDSYLLPQTTYVHLKGRSTQPSYAILKELRISQFYTIRKNLGVFKYIIFYSKSLLTYLLKAPFNRKNRKYLGLVIRGVSLSESLKQKQSIRE